MNIFWVSAMVPGTILSTGTTKVSKKNEVRVPTALLSKASDHINRGSKHNSRDWWMPEENKNRTKSQSLRKSLWKWHLMWDLNDKSPQPCRDLGTEHITQKDSKGKGLRLQTRGMPDSHKALRAGAEWAWAGAGQVPAQRGQSLHRVPAAGGATGRAFGSAVRDSSLWRSLWLLVGKGLYTPRGDTERPMFNCLIKKIF